MIETMFAVFGFAFVLMIVVEIYFKMMEYIVTRILFPHPCQICGKHTGPLHEHNELEE